MLVVGPSPTESRGTIAGGEGLGGTPTTQARDGLYVPVKWLAKLMAGETTCEWSPWFRAHYTGYRKAPFDSHMARWLADHSRLLSTLASESRAEGHAVFTESQNAFRLPMGGGLKLGGKPDLVAVRADGSMTIYDAKTGSPRVSDTTQVMLYMLCLPASPGPNKGRPADGCVVYGQGDRVPIPSSAITEAFKSNARYFLDLLRADEAPSRSASPNECRFCDLTRADCPDRVEWTDQVLDGETPTTVLE